MKNITIGITGGIAAYKIATLISTLRKKNYNVQVVMTKNACEFITPLTIETLSNNKVIVDTFDRNFNYDVQHISLAKKTDLFIIAPATANIIAKIANGLADDILSTTFLASNCPKIICPAMNCNMMTNKIVVDNIEKCKKYGMKIIESESGFLACGDIGVGRLAELDKIELEIEKQLTTPFLKNKKILITAGPTQESIDVVRYITNHSSGKMGYALAKQAYIYGADVTLLSGNVALKQLPNIDTRYFSSTNDLYNQISKIYQQFDAIIMSAAIADYTTSKKINHKIKKENNVLSLDLIKTVDILEYLGEKKLKNQTIIGFAMETENLIENAQKKLIRKKADFIIANSINDQNSGFKYDTNKITIIGKKTKKDYELMTKENAAKEILKYCFMEEENAINN